MVVGKPHLVKKGRRASPLADNAIKLGVILGLNVLVKFSCFTLFSLTKPGLHTFVHRSQPGFIPSQKILRVNDRERVARFQCVNNSNPTGTGEAGKTFPNTAESFMNAVLGKFVVSHGVISEGKNKESKFPSGAKTLIQTCLSQKRQA
jgi:hypothetical protein